MRCLLCIACGVLCVVYLCVFDGCGLLFVVCFLVSCLLVGDCCLLLDVCWLSCVAWLAVFVVWRFVFVAFFSFARCPLFFAF